MTPHRMVPVPLVLDEPDREPRWRCVGCGLVRRDPTPQLHDDCKASELNLDGAA